MRETKFIEQNKEKWEDFERILRSDLKNPDKLSDLFIQLTDDLSYARTFYPNRSVKVYLNNKAQQIFYSIYKNKSEKRRRFLLFWKEELPTIVFHARKELLLSLIIFSVAVIIGVVSSANDPDFSRVILGDKYIEMTNANIASGDPMAVYKKMNEIDMFLGITFNNLLVAFRTFIFGILMAIGTVAILLYNGIMVGTFQYFFIARGLFWDSFLSIWLHGTLEISAIIIAGGAGLVLGKGFAFPGSFTRLQAFQISAVRGFKLLMGIVPLLIFAALIEAFFTRYTDVPPVLKASVIFLSLSFVILYFIGYPYLKKKNGGLYKEQIPLAPKASREVFLSGRIKNNSEIFKDLFTFLGEFLKKLLMLNLTIALFYLPIAIFYLYDDFTPGFTVGIWLKWNFPLLFDYTRMPLMFILNTIVFSVNTQAVYRWILKRLSKEKFAEGTLQKRQNLKFGLGKTIMVTAVMHAVFFLSLPLAFVFFLIVCPLLLLVLFIESKEDVGLGKVLSRTFFLLNNCYSRLYGLTFLILFLGLLSYILIESPVIYFYYEILQWNIPLDTTLLQGFYYIFNTLITLISLALLLTLLASGIGMFYFTIVEINEAVALKNSIRRMGDKQLI